MKTSLKCSFALCVIGCIATAQAAFLLGVDHVNSSFSVFDTETETVIYTASVYENLTGLTYAGDNTYYGVVDTGSGTELYSYTLTLSGGELTYTSASASTVDPVVGPVGAVSYVDGELLTIENDSHYTSSSGKRYGELYSIDTGTAAATSLAVYNSRTEVEGLAYDGGDYLYYAETAYGNDTWIGAIDLTDYSDVYFGFYTRLDDETITGLAYADDTLYGVGSNGLYEFDMSTGAATLITSSWGSNIDALTLLEGVEVPEPGSAIAFLLLLGLPLWRKQLARA